MTSCRRLNGRYSKLTCTSATRAGRNWRQLGGTRLALASWSPPDSELGFRIVRNEEPKAEPRRPWFGFNPAWGLAAAAVLVLAAAAAISNVEMRYDRDGFVLRTGWAREAAPGAADAAGAAIRPPPRLNNGPTGCGFSISGCSSSNRTRPFAPWVPPLSMPATTSRRRQAAGLSDAELLRQRAEDHRRERSEAAARARAQGGADGSRVRYDARRGPGARRTGTAADSGTHRRGVDSASQHVEPSAAGHAAAVNKVQRVQEVQEVQEVQGSEVQKVQKKGSATGRGDNVTTGKRSVLLAAAIALGVQTMPAAQDQRGGFAPAESDSHDGERAHQRRAIGRRGSRQANAEPRSQPDAVHRSGAGPRLRPRGLRRFLRRRDSRAPADGGLGEGGNAARRDHDCRGTRVARPRRSPRCPKARRASAPSRH